MIDSTQKCTCCSRHAISTRAADFAKYSRHGRFCGWVTHLQRKTPIPHVVPKSRVFHMIIRKRLRFWYNIIAFSEEDVGLRNRAGEPSEMMLI